jgi:cytochrome c oxidase subunit III
MSTDANALTPNYEHDIIDTHHGIGTPVLGMLLFITSEVMFFAGLFAAYFTLRAGYQEVVNGQLTHVWPPTEFANVLVPFTLFTESGALNLIVPMTILLITSSFTCQLGVWGIRRDDHTAFRRNFAVTIVLGSLFLLMEMYDWSVLFHEGLSMSSTTFGTTYFTLTGFHGAHVFGGVVMLSVVLYRGLAGQFSSRHYDMVEATSLYWHFVDVVWILLFSVLYVL